MKPATKRWLKFALRWGIAFTGIFYVISNISLYNRVLVPAPGTGRPVAVRLAEPATEESESFRIIDPFSTAAGAVREVRRTALLVRSERDQVMIRGDDGTQRQVDVLALQVADSPDRAQWPLVVTPPRSLWMKYLNRLPEGGTQVVDPSRVVGRYDLNVPYTIIDEGLAVMASAALQNNPKYLWLAIFIFPTIYILTSIRWYMLLQALEIGLTLRRTFALNMVGAFYNSFMPGSTGGDLLKAYYVAKNTPHRTRAVMSVLIDRLLGLLALVLLGGTAATIGYWQLPENDPAKRACAQVAIGSIAIVTLTALALLVYYNPMLRKYSGLDFIIQRLPMQTQVAKAMHTMELYRRRPLLVLWAIIMTLPVHATVVLSAMFAGMAFGLPLTAPYYWVAVPVIVLSGAVPISPQGAGVMEFFAIILTRRQGCTISQAFALTMSIRIVQMLWNLTGGIFVLRGGYHAPGENEARELEEDPSPVAPGEALSTRPD
jgi:uncharacterized protein (TIRG00374 family)